MKLGTPGNKRYAYTLNKRIVIKPLENLAFGAWYESERPRPVFSCEKTGLQYKANGERWPLYVTVRVLGLRLWLEYGYQPVETVADRGAW